MLKQMASGMSRSAVFTRLVGIFEHLDRETPDLLRVLTYHRVARSDVDPVPPPGVAVTPVAFAEQMGWVRAQCNAVGVEEVLSAIQGRRQLPRRSVLITFDDGYRDFRTEAWPVLRSLGLPVVLFVPTAFPGDSERRFWWDRLHHALTTTARRDSLATPLGPLSLASAGERRAAYLRLRAFVKSMQHQEALDWVAATCAELGTAPEARAILNWAELRELAAEGVTIASHTRTHPLLTRVPPEVAREEVRESLRDLERELGSAPPILAYPAGAFDDDVVRILAGEGTQLGFTTVRGINDLRRSHPLKLRRINVGQGTPLAALRAQVLARSLGLNRLHRLESPSRPAKDDAYGA
jgi:peptidoglycan/xylan/chitin deacetylase (PgdA/CDA1 family)